ncbi:hypothetical protein [Streptomyces sp. NPDC093105]|uniref:hypothetical protein n=1 Tax=Streptomyces sp. NPDC093105 TaxID=3366029 RepID=UPI0037F522BC
MRRAGYGAVAAVAAVVWGVGGGGPVVAADGVPPAASAMTLEWPDFPQAASLACRAPDHPLGENAAAAALAENA